MLDTLISILFIAVDIIIAGWIFYDAYSKKRYSKGLSITWTIGALISPILVLLFYLLFRPPQDWVLKRGVGKLDPEFMERKYRLLDNILMVIAIIACGIIIFLFDNVIPIYTQIFQEVGVSLSVVCKIALILGNWVWAIGFLLLIGIIFFFKHPKLVRFHRRHAPQSYVIYIIAIMFGSGIIVGLSMYPPHISTMIE